MKQKRTVLCQLKKQRRATLNLLEAIEVLPYADKSCVSSLKRTVTFMNKQIESIEKEIVSVTESEFESLYKRLCTVKGIGAALATALIIATGGFTSFSNAKQFSRYIGDCPTVCKSGTSVNIRGSINRNGDETIRSMLYVASWSAIRSNAACKEMYQRLRKEGKSGKLAIVAVSNKLIRQCFAVVKNNTTYIDGFVSAKPEPRKLVLDNTKA